MKIRNKVIPLALSIILSVSIFSACKNNDSQADDNSSTTTTTQAITTESEMSSESNLDSETSIVVTTKAITTAKSEEITTPTTTTSAVTTTVKTTTTAPEVTTIKTTTNTTIKATTTTPKITTTAKATTTAPKVTTTVPTTTKPVVISGDMTIKDISAVDLVKKLNIGWNLGNTLDSTASWISNGTPTQYETAWGNPKTTKAMIDEIKKAGFNTIRIPTSWGEHTGSSPNYTLNTAWLDRVQEVVDYAFDNDMYVILNCHHEEWHYPSYDNLNSAKAQLTKTWTQIAARFKDYDEHLIFEGMNEPRMNGTNYEWTGGTPESRDVINQLNTAFVNTIRNSTGNNPLRILMIPTYAASSSANVLKDFNVPNDDKIIVSIHAYTPYNFALNAEGTSTWSSTSASDKRDIDSLMTTLNNTFISKGIPVIIGEFGARNKDNLSARVAWAEYFVKSAKAIGIPSIWWDNGGFTGTGECFGLFNRKLLKWEFPEIITALMKGIK